MYFSERVFALNPFPFNKKEEFMKKKYLEPDLKISLMMTKCALLASPLSSEEDPYQDDKY